MRHGGSNHGPLTFKAKQGHLSVDTPTKAGKPAIFAHHPVAGHEQRHGIGTTGLGHGSTGQGHAQLCRQRPVANGMAAGDAAQRLPNQLLKGGAAQIKGQGRVAGAGGAYAGER